MLVFHDIHCSSTHPLPPPVLLPPPPSSHELHRPAWRIAIGVSSSEGGALHYAHTEFTQENARKTRIKQTLHIPLPSRCVGQGAAGVVVEEEGRNERGEGWPNYPAPPPRHPGLTTGTRAKEGCHSNRLVTGAQLG